jgi:hypothetical protein
LRHRCSAQPAAAAARFGTFKRSYNRSRCLLTVRRRTPSLPAICLSERPSATNRRMSSCRAVRWISASGGSPPRTWAWAVPIARETTDRSSRVAPTVASNDTLMAVLGQAQMPRPQVVNRCLTACERRSRAYQRMRSARHQLMCDSSDLGIRVASVVPRGTRCTSLRACVDNRSLVELIFETHACSEAGGGTRHKRAGRFSKQIRIG